MNTQKAIYILIIILLLSCNKKPDFIDDEYPCIITNEVIIKDTSVVFSADILSKDIGTVISYGFIWTSSVYTDFSDYVCELKGEILKNSFSAEINHYLINNQKMYVKAFLKTRKYTIYGNTVEFVFNNVPRPEIFDFYPKTGFDNTEITIIGKNFDSSVVFVYLEDIPLSIKSIKNDTIICSIPDNSRFGSFPLTVSVGGISVVSDYQFNLIHPVIIEIAPDKQYVGNTCRIFGNNLLIDGFTTKLLINNNDISILELDTNFLSFIVPQVNPPSYFNLKIKIGEKETSVDIQCLSRWELFSEITDFSYSPYINTTTYNNVAYILDYDYLYKFNETTGQISYLSAFPGTITGSSFMFAYDDYIYIGTGFLGFSYTNLSHEFWKYSILNNNWTQIEDLSFSLWKSTSEVVGDKAYILGGVNLINSSGFHYEYNLSNNTWVTFSDFPYSTRYDKFNSFFVNNRLFITCGDDISNLWELDLNTNTWVQLPNLEDGNGIGHVVNNNIYMLVYKSNINTTWKYDLQLNKWINLENLSFDINYGKEVFFEVNKTGYYIDRYSDHCVVYKFTPPY